MNMMIVGQAPPAQSRLLQIQDLLSEARSLAADHVAALEAALEEVGTLAAAINDGGDVFPPGVRDLARRLADDAPWACQTLAVLRRRTLLRQPEIWGAQQDLHDSPEDAGSGAG